MARIIIQDGETYRGLGLQRSQQLLGGRNILEAKDSGAVEREHLRLRLKRLALQCTCRSHLIQHDARTGHGHAAPTATTDNIISLVLIDQWRMESMSTPHEAIGHPNARCVVLGP